MNDFFYAIGDLFEALFPLFKAVGKFVNAFWTLGILSGIVGWTAWMIKNKDAVEKFD